MLIALGCVLFFSRRILPIVAQATAISVVDRKRQITILLHPRRRLAHIHSTDPRASRTRRSTAAARLEQEAAPCIVEGTKGTACCLYALDAAVVGGVADGGHETDVGGGVHEVADELVGVVGEEQGGEAGAKDVGCGGAGGVGCCGCLEGLGAGDCACRYLVGSVRPSKALMMMWTLERATKRSAHAMKSGLTNVVEAGTVCAANVSVTAGAMMTVLMTVRMIVFCLPIACELIPLLQD